MARYTSAYSSFVSRLAEVEILRRSAREKEELNPVGLRREINALCRGAIVLLNAHLEAYIKELGEVTLDSIYKKRVSRNTIAPQFYYHLSKDILDELKETSDPLKIADKLFSFLQSDTIFWTLSGPFPQPLPVDRFNKGFSNPAFQKIKVYFNRFGYSEYKDDLAHFLRADYRATINMVDQLVDTRNKIAHGDPTITKTPTDIKDMAMMIRSYCNATDTVFASWCKNTLCAIR